MQGLEQQVEIGLDGAVIDQRDAHRGAPADRGGGRRGLNLSPLLRAAGALFIQELVVQVGRAVAGVLLCILRRACSLTLGQRQGRQLAVHLAQ